MSHPHEDAAVSPPASPTDLVYRSTVTRVTSAGASSCVVHFTHTDGQPGCSRVGYGDWVGTTQPIRVWPPRPGDVIRVAVVTSVTLVERPKT